MAAVMLDCQLYFMLKSNLTFLYINEINIFGKHSIYML